MSEGRFIAVVGPSGVGKDSVINALVAARPGLTRVRRVITRDAEAGGEEFDSASPETFRDMAAEGAFALWWQAHEMYYGIPSDSHTVIQSGADVIANLSRAALGEADRVFANCITLHITARPEILAERLAARGRETPDEIAKRLARKVSAPEGANVIEIDNSGALEDSVQAALAALYPESA